MSIHLQSIGHERSYYKLTGKVITSQIDEFCSTLYHKSTCVCKILAINNIFVYFGQTPTLKLGQFTQLALFQSVLACNDERSSFVHVT